jgi:hypothetical protein
MNQNKNLKNQPWGNRYEIWKIGGYSPPNLHSSFFFFLSITDNGPRTARVAVDSKYSELSINVMVEEMDSLDKNEAWDLVELLSRIKNVRIKWDLNKLNVEHKVENYNDFLIAKGY